MTNRRTHQTILLLNTLLDTLPGPTTWTGQLVQHNALPGPAPSRWQHCHTCDAAGTLLDKFNRSSQCPMCAGHGRYRIDDYTGQRISTHENTFTAPLTTVRCDRCNGDGVWKFKRCELCAGSGRRTVSPHNLTIGHDQDRKLKTLDLWGQTGSYHELDHALEHLRATDTHAFRIIWHVHVARDAEAPLYEPLVDELVAWIARRMPNPILVPAGVASADKRANAHRLRTHGRHVDVRARSARDAEIRKLHRHGKPVQWIAQQSGLSVSSVYAILTKHGSLNEAA